MAQYNSTLWSPQLKHPQAMTILAEEDFSTFIDMDGNDMNFPIFDASTTNLPTGHDTSTHDVTMQMDAAQEYMSLEQYQCHVDSLALEASQQQSQPHHFQNAGSITNSFDPHIHFDPAQAESVLLQEQTYQLLDIVPPTPNSSELFPDSRRHASQLDSHAQRLLQQHQQLTKMNDAMAFTPMVSPDVIGTDSYYNFSPQYNNMPGSYMSPLTSPAINPQFGGHGQGQRQAQSHTADSSLAASPINLDHGALDYATDMSCLNEPPRKTRKKATATRPSTAASRVRASPTTAPQRRTSSLKVVTKDVVQAISEGTIVHRDGNSQDSSTSHSVSPQSLSETVMAPPPKPVTSTPMMPRRASSGLGLSAGGPGPATPASLMKLQQKRKTSGKDSGETTPMKTPQSATGELAINFQDLVLPEATLPETAGGTPVGTPVLGAQSHPRSAGRAAGERGCSVRLHSVAPSPAMGALSSPTLPPKSGGRATTGTKKRGGVNSVLASPALRPKLSPSIKPLLPQGSEMSEEARTLLLATKSNYQNLVEGNNLTGVTYPTELSTNLTSKKTSHKIAEQGRRNRINTALHEMQALLPAVAAGTSAGAGGTDRGEDSDSGSEEKAKLSSGGSNSKAATVEHAIVYIKDLVSELEDEKRQTQKLREQVASLRDQLVVDARAAQ